MAFNLVNNIVEWLKSHVILVIGVLLFCFFLYWLYNRGKKKELKPLSRSEIERKNFIERMKLNGTSYKWLYRGNNCIGKIKALMPTYLTKGTEKAVFEMVVKPVITIIGNLKFVNPFAKDKCIMINVQTILEMNRVKNYIDIDEKVTFDKVFGIYYDRRFEPETIDYILANSLFRTDWDSWASIYFAKSQEQSTFDPMYAHQILMKQQELEIEKQKRAKLTE